MELVGRLTSDAKINSTKGEKKVVNFSVAVNDSYKPKGSEHPVKITTFFNCSYWINPAIVQYLPKGTLVELNGRISVNAWNNAEGEAKASLNFHVNTIKLYGKSNNSNNSNHKDLDAEKEKSQKTSPINAEDLKEPLEDLPF